MIEMIQRNLEFFKKTPVILGLVIIFIITNGMITTGYAGVKHSNIRWKASYQKEGLTFIPGSFKSNKKTYNIAWKVGPGTYRQFVVFDSKSGGSQEEKLFLFYDEKGSTAIYRNIPSGNNQLPELRKLATVKTKNLHAKLKTAYVPKNTGANQEVKSIEWGKADLKNKVTLIPGNISANFGNFNFLIKVGSDKTLSVIYLEAPGGAELKPLETPLYLLPDEDRETTEIFREIKPLNNSDNPPVLQRIAAVRTEELKAGLKQFSSESAPNR